MNTTKGQIKNNIFLFQNGPLSQWYGAFKDQNSKFTMDLSSWTPFFQKTSTRDIFLNYYDNSDKPFHIEFNCAEQAMMFSKAIIFGDIKTSELILNETHPKNQKDLGRQVNNFNPEYWDKIKVNLITLINYKKFSQNEELKKMLLDTGFLILAEASPWDKIWGIGLSYDDPKSWDVTTWEGQNCLGRALMNVREKLR